MRQLNVFLIGVLWLAATTMCGCGKDVKLSVKAADTDKDQPTAALVRKVELTYRDGSGKEQMRESLAVVGLSQPVSARSDLLKGIHVEPAGVFEARGYTSDGGLMLRGWAHPPEDSEVVEVTMSREGSQAVTLGSSVLRKVRLSNVPAPKEFQIEAGELRARIQRDQCVELPPLRIDGESAQFPKLVFEGTIKAPSLKFQVGARVENGRFRAWMDLASMKINGAGDPEIELGREFLNGALLKSPARFVLRVHAEKGEYEGCFDITTHPEFKVPTVSFYLGPGIGKPYMQWRMEDAGELVIRNPNSVPLKATFKAILTSTETGRQMRPVYRMGAEARAAVDMYWDRAIIHEAIEIEPHSQRSLSLFGASRSEFGPQEMGFTTSHIALNWTLSSKALADREEEFPVLSGEAKIP